MTIKKLLKWQPYWIDFLLGFNFIIFCTLGREKRKVDSLTCQLNDCLVDDYDNE